MSDSDPTGENNSILTNFKNKAYYTLYKNTYDPNANVFTTERAQKQKEQEKLKEEKAKEDKNKDKNTKNKGLLGIFSSNNDTTETINTPDNGSEQKTEQGDPNKFSSTRLISKIGSQVVSIIKSTFFPFLALMLAMIVSNEMIVFAVPIRIIFFIFTFILCYSIHYTAILLMLYYIGKGGYSYWNNNMSGRPKIDIMPRIFALLPISTFKPTTNLQSFFMYPFTYPKSIKGEEKLPVIMKNYEDSLNASFPDLDRVRNLPIFVHNLKAIHKDLSNLHKMADNTIPSMNTTTTNSSINTSEQKADGSTV
jgi:hypothetical protein